MRVSVELFQGSVAGRQPTNSGIRAELDQVFGARNSSGTSAGRPLFRHFRAEADAGRSVRPAMIFPRPVERAAADEQDVGRCRSAEFLVRMLCGRLRLTLAIGAFHQLGQRLLRLARHVAGDGRLSALRVILSIVDVDDAALRLLDIVVAPAGASG